MDTCAIDRFFACMYKAIIIEDEYPARLRLQYILSMHQDTILLCGAADTGRDGIALIKSHHPDIIFLDIHLPDMNGFKVLSALDYHPMVIFTTAYAEYAIQAFEVFSVDYLVKPFDEDRFRKAIEKIGHFARQTHQPDYLQLAELFFKAQIKPKQTTIAVKSGQKILLIDFEDITHIKADDKYVTISLADNKTFLCEKSLAMLTDVLPDNFIRVHRSYIINKTWIAEIHRYFKGRLMLVLDDKDRTAVITSDSYTQDVKAALGL
ncbi:MAG: LytTR family DNA-binding domain-containing protein [Saprospiraceae bacterium]|nr:response regulator transcription factor [Saprospiraceae bacterium]MBP6445934.1 response regulator transcription factor [Saprospiraceae bacterium]